MGRSAVRNQSDSDNCRQRVSLSRGDTTVTQKTDRYKTRLGEIRQAMAEVQK